MPMIRAIDHALERRCSCPRIFARDSY